MTATGADGVPVRLRTRLLGLAGRALVLEVRMYDSILRLLLRRPAIAAGATGFRYDAPTRLLVVVFIVVSAVELVVVDVLVHRWPLVRFPFLVLGIWGLVWMVGLLCSLLVRPHTVGPGGLVVRDGMDLDVTLPWEAVDMVRTRRRSYADKPPRVLADQGSRVLVVAVSQETDVEVVLARPRTVRLPGRRTVEVDAVRLWADDPAALVAAATSAQRAVASGQPSES
ncbi:hypothetical protein ASG49_07525 [Marmoricola sp. Leaf446]|uniref:hypothetical protein n=1 Tax=Marmoricola sp. Leaf446 TaxID=1736379 RepID=UPI0006F2C48D|nr:hypothetical protein [Marmoricola sp. Leaf446]KQT94672.1 hypothetical protein ASG49_07525 [Marmoricola sp. Leaf446]